MRARKIDRAESVADRRASILDAARSVFARKGFTDTMVEDIAEQAGIGKGTVYLYFRSKSDVYLAVLMEDARYLDDLTRSRMEVASSWDGKLRAYIETKVEFLDSNPDSVRIYLAEFRSLMLRGLPVPVELYNMSRENEGKIAQIIAAGIATGEIRTVDPELAAMAVSDLTRGLMERRLMQGSRVNVEFVMDMIYRSLAAS